MTFISLGHAINPTNTDLDQINQTSANAAATANSALATATQAVAALAIVPNPTGRRTVRTLAEHIANSAELWLGDYGVVGDGVADDDDALDLALLDGAELQRVVYGGSMVVRVQRPHTMSGPGLVFDAAAFGNAGDPGLFADGTGFGATPVLTITGQPCALNVTVYGSGQTANGVYFDNPQRATIQQVRVYNFDGYGIKIDKCWDCDVDVFSVELCGNATDYAFSMNDGGDTCNQTHIGRLQVEQAKTQAITISPNSLALTIDSIHSERLRSPDSSKYAWILGGASSSYNAGRFTSSGTSANAKLWLRAAHADYTALRGESITVYLEGTVSTGLTLVSPDLATCTTQEYPGQSGVLVILGGNYGTWTGSTTNRYAYQGGSAFLPLSGGTLTGNLGIGGTVLRKNATYPGFGVSASATASIASGGGTVDIADGNTIAICCITTDGGGGAIVLLEGGVHNTLMMAAATGGTWSGTQGTATAFNVYWNSGTSTYRLENTTGSNRTFYITKIGAVPTG